MLRLVTRVHVAFVVVVVVVAPFSLLNKMGRTRTAVATARFFLHQGRIEVKFHIFLGEFVMQGYETCDTV